MTNTETMTTTYHERDTQSGYAVERRRDGQPAGYAEFIGSDERAEAMERLQASLDEDGEETSEHAERAYDWVVEGEVADKTCDHGHMADPTSADAGTCLDCGACCTCERDDDQPWAGDDDCPIHGCEQA